MLSVRHTEVKTANLNSRINFYFVTCFYCLDNICMLDMKYMFFDKKYMFFDKKFFPNELLGYLQVFQDFSYDLLVGFVDCCHVY